MTLDTCEFSISSFSIAHVTMRISMKHIFLGLNNLRAYEA